MLARQVAATVRARRELADGGSGRVDLHRRHPLAIAFVKLNQLCVELLSQFVFVKGYFLISHFPDRAIFLLAGKLATAQIGEVVKDILGEDASTPRALRTLLRDSQAVSSNSCCGYRGVCCLSSVLLYT